MEEVKPSEIAKKTKEEKKEKSNYWKISTIVLAVIAIVAIVFMFAGGITGNVISESEIGQLTLDFFNTKLSRNPGTLVSIDEVSGLYKITISAGGQEVPLYCTKDGKFIYQGSELISLSGEVIEDKEETPREIPKSDKPKAEAFVFSYCPYGTQFEKALLPVYNLLKDKADINIVAIGAMHGEYEKTESLRQLCVQKLYGKDKLFAYLDKFLADSAIGNCNGDSNCLKPLLDKIYSQLGINKADVESCMVKDAEALYNADNSRANEFGISGSPTFVINGVQVSVSRSPASIEQAICSAFNTAPEECAKTLSSESATPGFGSASSSSSSSASCG